MPFEGVEGTVHESGISRWQKVEVNGIGAWDKSPETWRATITEQEAIIAAMLEYLDGLVDNLNILLVGDGQTPQPKFNAVPLVNAEVPEGGAPFASELGYRVEAQEEGDGPYIRVDIGSDDVADVGGPPYVTLNSGQNWLDFWNIAVGTTWIGEVDGTEMVNETAGDTFVYGTTTDGPTSVTVRPPTGYGPAFVISFDDPGKVVG